MARKRIVGIYMVKSITGKIYIGQSIYVQKRLQGYKKLENIDRQVKLGRSLRKHGAEGHAFELIEECDVNDLNERERYWQDFYDCTGKMGLNCYLTKTSDKKPFISDETRKKMSEAGKRKMANISESHLAKIREAAKRRIGTKGTPRTEEQKRRQSEISKQNARYGEANNMFNSQRFGKKNPFHGKKHTEESRSKISEKAKGRKPSEDTLKKYSEQRLLGKNPVAKMVLNTESGIYYSCGKEAWLSTSKKYVYSTFKSKLNGSNKHPLSFVYV